MTRDLLEQFESEVNAADRKFCRDCAFFEQGECMRHPPQMVPNPNDNQHPIAYWPIAMRPHVSENEWCGEWERRR